MEKVMLIVSLILTGCDGSPDIRDGVINDRVKACSAGFSNETGASLNASLDKASLKGDLSGDFKHETKSSIFSEIPGKDRIKAYEDYISCIEKNWNGITR